MSRAEGLMKYNLKKKYQEKVNIHVEALEFDIDSYNLLLSKIFGQKSLKVCRRRSTCKNFRSIIEISKEVTTTGHMLRGP